MLAILLFIPAYIANGVPPLLAKIIPWSAPLDCGHSIRGKRIFGKNKTWRGFLGGILVSGLVFLLMLQFNIVAGIHWSFGFLMGAGALCGDAIESFLKRQVGVKPGKPFIPLDQIDYTVGAYALTAWLYWPGWDVAALILLFNTALTLGSHYIGYLIGINKDPI